MTASDTTPATTVPPGPRGHVDVHVDHVFCSALEPGQTAQLSLPVVRVVDSPVAASPESLDVRASLHQANGKKFTSLRFTLNDVTTVVKLTHGIDNKDRPRPLEALLQDFIALAKDSPVTFYCYMVVSMVVFLAAFIVSILPLLKLFEIAYRPPAARNHPGYK